VLYVLDDSGGLPLRLNTGMVVAERGAGEELRALLELHLRHTGSARSAALLEDWQRSSALFWRVLPRASAEGAVEDGALQIASA
jgi:glutamate synthase domain-containing protein 3